MPATVVLHGHSGIQADCMGVYDHDGEFNGMPLFKSRHKYFSDHIFLFRDANGGWMVGKEEDMPTNMGCIRSASKGALLPLGLVYEVDGESGWEQSAELAVVTQL